MTPFYSRHLALGARMVDFAGFMMPVMYSSIKDEHRNVRENVGIFDVSHMGQFILRGKDSAALIQRLCCNDIGSLDKGQAQYSCLINDRGGIVDDLLIYHLPDGAYMMVVNAANIEKDFKWILQQKQDAAVEVLDISEKTAMIAVQGPNAVKVLKDLTTMDLEGMRYYHFEKGVFHGCEKVVVSATGYTGAGGFEIYSYAKDGPAIWDALMEKGKPLGMKPAGLASRDTLRLEKAYCLYGNDITEETTPLEAGLGWITALDTEFVGREALLKQKSAGVQRQLIAFELLERGIARKGNPIVDVNEDVIGEVTSGTMSPTMDKAIGLAYVPRQLAGKGTDLRIKIRNKLVQAIVVKKPFV